MRPIDELRVEEARGLRGLLFDLDDTLLDAGKLSAKAYEALHRLAESGLELVAVTGRPSSWGAVLARQWPICGVVSENGAVCHYEEQGRVHLWDAASGEERQRRRATLVRIADRVADKFPELRISDDSDARKTDIAFDIGEFASVPKEIVDRAAAFAREAGARVITSSIHLHLTLDGDDKASGTIAFLRARFGLDATECRFRFAFIGDSENDASCFTAFHTTFAVRNFRGRLTVPPRFITRAPAGAGFVEAAEMLISRRNGPNGSSAGTRR